MKATKYISLRPLVSLSEMVRPLDPPALFGRSAPLEIEIGTGNGEFLARTAADTPARDFLGLDNEWPCVHRALRRIAQAGATNARMMLADAMVLFRRFLASRSVDRVICLFPMPWPKGRHASRRLFGSAFLRLLNARLKDGGEALLVTDDRDFADWVTEGQGVDGFEFVRNTIPPSFDTKYGRKWEGRKRPVFHELIFRKTVHIGLPVGEDVPVKPHDIDSFDPKSFHPEDQAGALTVRFRDILYDPERETMLVRIHLIEDDFPQTLFIRILRREKDWRISVVPGGWVPTAGVQRALDIVRDSATGGSTPASP